MLLQIHDELVFETPDERVTEVMPLITEQMEAAMTLKVPLVADAAAGKEAHATKHIAKRTCMRIPEVEVCLMKESSHCTKLKTAV